MRKYFSLFGLCIMIIVSFLYSSNVTSVIKEYDDIMLKIKEESVKYNSPVIDGVVEGNYIIPGVSGKEVDINKSYREMREIGVYNDKFLNFNEVKPKNSLKDNMDKIIIGGNKIKNIVSFIFMVENYDSIDVIKNIIDKYGDKLTFFIDGYFFENNMEDIKKLFLKGLEIESSGYNHSYGNSSYVWVDNTLKNLFTVKNNFCLNTENNNPCMGNKNFIIEPIYINNNYFVNTKKIIESGSIIAFPINQYIAEEFELIINYTLSKGYNIDNISELLKE